MDPQSENDSASNGHRFSSDDPQAAFKSIPGYVSELTAYANHFVSAKLDAVKVSLRNAVLMAIVGVLAGVMGATLIVTSVVLLLLGISHGLGALFGGRNWLGDLIVGLILVGGFTAVVLYVLKRTKGAVGSNTVRKYEAAREHQRSRFGHDVADEAATAGRVANG